MHYKNRSMGKGKRATNLVCMILATAGGAVMDGPSEAQAGVGATLASLQPGDANGSGVVDVNDALVVARYSGGLGPQPFYPEVADANCSGQIDINDALLIARYSAGLVTGFPCPHLVASITDITFDGSMDQVTVQVTNQGNVESTWWAVTVEIGYVSLYPVLRANYVRTNDRVEFTPIESNARIAPGASISFQYLAALHDPKLVDVSIDAKPRVNILMPQAGNVILLNGYVAKATAADTEDGTVPPERCNWQLKKGTEIISSGTGLEHTVVVPTLSSTYVLRFTAVDSRGRSATVERSVKVHGWDGDLAMGLSLRGTSNTDSYETTMAHFTVPSEDVGKYFHVTLAPQAGYRMQAFVVRGDRDWRSEDYASDERENLMARLTTPIAHPELEFAPWEPGNYTLGLRSLTDVAEDWREPMVAPAGMNVHYTLDKATSSQAAAAGKSIFIAMDYFGPTFDIDGEKSVDTSTFDFATLEAGYNRIFGAYTRFLGSDRTVYGSTVGVTYPADPHYGYCGDSSSPINIGCWSTRTMVAGAIEHEMAHVFSQSYPFMYSFPFGEQGCREKWCEDESACVNDVCSDGKACRPGDCSNGERIVDYFIGWLLSPEGGAGVNRASYGVWEQETLEIMGGIKAPAYWFRAVADIGLPAFLRRISGDWQGIESVFRSYSASYTGNHQDGRTGYQRAVDFYTKLADSIPDPAKRQAFYGQLSKWGCPFVAPATSYVDADNDGIVAGIDPDDHNPAVNLVDEECYPGATTSCVADGLDQNGDGYADMGLLLPSETIALGDHALEGQNRSTRRKIYFAPEQVGHVVQVASSTARDGRIDVYQCNPSFGKKGLMPISDANCTKVAVNNTTGTRPFLWFFVPAAGVYTFDFIEKTIGTDPIASLEYRFSVTAP